MRALTTSGYPKNSTSTTLRHHLEVVRSTICLRPPCNPSTHPNPREEYIQLAGKRDTMAGPHACRVVH